MEKINIAELLKDYPTGMKLDCTMFDDVVFERIDSESPGRYIVLRRLKSNTTFYVSKYGQFYNTEDAKCVIFPKGMTSWKAFVPPCKFKVGDYIRQNKKNTVRLVSEVCDNYYLLDEKDISLPFFAQDDWELVPDKFDITTLKPFDKVLVRSNVGQRWTHDVFGFTDKDKGFPFVCVGHYASQCIPYEGNEHLLGTVNDCDEYYKTWE